MNSKPIIHIGFPKTGTTWLQKEFFPNVEDINFIQRNDIIEYILKPNTFEFDPNLAKKYFENGKRNVICDEILVGGLDVCFGNGAFIKETGNRLKQIFNEAEIIIFIRNQPSIVASAYFQYIKAGGNFSATKFLNKSNKHYSFLVNQMLFSYDIFKFDQCISFYKKLYGNENVQVFLYEDFNENKTDFLNKFKQKYNLKIDVETLNIQTYQNQRYKNFIIKLARFTNSFSLKRTIFKYYIFHIPYFYNLCHRVYIKLNKYCFFIKNSSDESIIGKKNMKIVNDYYKESNKNLIEKHGVENITKYNYPL